LSLFSFFFPPLPFPSFPPRRGACGSKGIKERIDYDPITLRRRISPFLLFPFFPPSSYSRRMTSRVQMVSKEQTSNDTSRLRRRPFLLHPLFYPSLLFISCDQIDLIARRRVEEKEVKVERRSRKSKGPFFFLFILLITLDAATLSGSRIGRSLPLPLPPSPW